MLNMLRDSLKQSMWPKWILLAVAGAMVLYLGQLFSCDDGPAAIGGNWAASVNGQPISLAEFRNEAREIDRSYQQLLGTSYQQFKSQFQIGTQAIQNLIARNMILQDARRLGLTVKTDEIVERVQTEPALLDDSGRFVGKDEYTRRISRAYPGGVVGFETMLEDNLLVGKWVHAMTQSVTIDEADLEREFRARTEKTAIDYVVVASADRNSDITIDDDELRRYYEQNADRYMRDEGRSIRYLVVERQAQLDRIELTDDDVREYYEANRGNFAHPEQRQARHILFRTEPEMDETSRAALRSQAEETLTRLQGGEDFATLARAMSQDPVSAAQGGDLGWFGRGDMVPAFDDAVFNTPVGQFAGVVETQFGFHVIQVTAGREAGTLPLEEVEGRIRPELRLRRAQEAVQAEAQRLRGEIAGPADLETVAAREGLALLTRFVNEAEGFGEIGASTEFRQTVSLMAPGEVSDPLTLGNGMALVTVDEIVPRSVAPLAQVDARVRTDLLNDRAREAALTDAREALERGRTLAGAAKRLGLEVQDSGDLAPGQGLPGTGGLAPEFEERLFGDEIAVGESGVIDVPAGALIYDVTRREPFDPAAYADARDEIRLELLEQRRNELVNSLVEELRRRDEIVINDEIVGQFNG